jgi:hypothetical protein
VIARATIAAAASHYGLDLRDDSRETNHTTSSTRALTRYRRLTENLVLRRPLEPGQYTSYAFTQILDDHGVLASIGSFGDATTARRPKALSTPPRPS